MSRTLGHAVHGQPMGGGIVGMAEWVGQQGQGKDRGRRGAGRRVEL